MVNRLTDIRSRRNFGAYRQGVFLRLIRNELRNSLLTTLRLTTSPKH
jgi:hypothetical protein